MARRTSPTVPFAVEVSLDPGTPTLIDDGGLLEFAIVTRDSLPNLDPADWDTTGNYILLGPIKKNGWRAYVGQATKLKSRLYTHRNDNAKDWFTTAVLVRHKGGLNRAHIAWLENELHQALNDAGGVQLDNGVIPGTEANLDRFDRVKVASIPDATLHALAIIGYRPGHTGQSRAANQAAAGPRPSAVPSTTTGSQTPAPTGRDAWVARAGEPMVALGDQVLAMAAEIAGHEPVFVYRGPYCALQIGGRGAPFILVRPRQNGLVVEFTVPQSPHIPALLNEAGIEDMGYSDTFGQHRLRITPNQFSQARAVLAQLTREAWQARNHNAAESATGAVGSPGPPDGTALTLNPDIEYRVDTRQAVRDYLAADPCRGQATWDPNGTKHTLIWTVDGTRHTPTGLANHILTQIGLPTQPLRGPAMWFAPDGRSIAYHQGHASR